MMEANDQAHGYKTTRYEKVHIFYTRAFPMHSVFSACFICRDRDRFCLDCDGFI